MAGIEVRNFDSSDKTRMPDKTTVETVRWGGARWPGDHGAGWRWSEAIKPIVRTDDCQAHHLGVVLSGQVHIVHRDGSEVDLNAGDVYDIEPGHDEWVLGHEPYVRVEFDDTTVASSRD